MFSTRWIPAALVLLTSGAFAQDDDAPWLLSLSALRDENAYEHAVASFHLGVGADTWVAVTAGSSHAPSIENDVRARLLAADVEHDFGPVGMALGVESWGDADNLEAQDLRGELFFSGDRYRFALLLEQRDIDIYFSGSGAPRVTDLRRIGVDADALGLSVRYRLSPYWQVYGAWMDYDYPSRMQVVPRADRLKLLSASAVTLAYSFVDRYVTFGVERGFGRTLLNIDVGRDRSAIDRSELTSLSASVLFPLAARLDLEFTIGSSRLDGGSSSQYGGLSLLIYGGG
jgi:hypothetical protein